MPGKRLNSQAQELVLKLISYFKAEKRHGGPIISINFVNEEVASALGISAATVCGIKKRKFQNPVLSNPGKGRPFRKLKTRDLLDTTKMEVRNIIYDMYRQRNMKLLS